jgi:Fe-Mn family superoxide dismutase
MLTRRDALRRTAAGAVLFALPRTAAADTPPPFTLPKLPYAYDALEPYIDAKTMEIHHSKHHNAYVENLNKALGKTDQAGKTLEAILGDLKGVPEKSRAAVRNNGGGHWNHTFFWQSMAKGGGKPAGDLLKAIEASFGSLDQFKQEWKAQAVAHFGSGWAWLEKGDSGGKPLKISTTQNQDNPLMAGRPAPLLGIDVWEHAYYLKYQNKRADYVDAWLNVVNWDNVAWRFGGEKKRSG